MAALKRLLVWLLLALIFTHIAANYETPNQDDAYEPEVSDSSLKIELDELKSKILILESSFDERTREIKTKDENIKQLEVIILQKSTSLASLKGEIQSLQEKESLDATEQVGKAHARVGELKKQVDNLKREITKQKTEKDALEGRANVAERKIQELNLKLNNLQKISEEQKIRIRRTEHALQAAEEEMMRVQFEATHISKELMEVHGSWLPPWLAGHLLHCQSFIVTQWNEHGRPALIVTNQKALELKDQVQKLVEPHIDALQTKWIPIIKEQWIVFVTNIEPNMQLLIAKTVEVYHASRDTLRPHIVNVQKLVDPYFQEAKKFTKPYINQVSTMTKPHVDKARTFLKPYTKKVLRGYRKLMKATIKYHRQVRTTIHETLKGHELTSPLATNELVWFMASAFMLLPVIFLFRMASDIFSKKPKKRARATHTSHTRRRAKRVHPDK